MAVLQLIGTAHDFIRRFHCDAAVRTTDVIFVRTLGRVVSRFVAEGTPSLGRWIDERASRLGVARFLEHDVRARRLLDGIVALRVPE